MGMRSLSLAERARQRENWTMFCEGLTPQMRKRMRVMQVRAGKPRLWEAGQQILMRPDLLMSPKLPPKPPRVPSAPCMQADFRWTTLPPWPQLG